MIILCNHWRVFSLLLLLLLLPCYSSLSHSFSVLQAPSVSRSSVSSSRLYDSLGQDPQEKAAPGSRKKICVIGAGWGGLSVAHALSKQDGVDITVIDGAPRVGGLVRDGFTTVSGQRPAEAGQHGFWSNYHNIYRLLSKEIPGFDMETAFTKFAEQGQYSPRGLEAVWPVYQQQSLNLPTGLAQAVYTRFLNLSLLDRATAFPLILAFSEFDDSLEAWERYDQISFRDLCIKLGVSKKCYEEAFEPMILTGLFAPGSECSAAAALGMAYFFVLQSQSAFDVQWCRGNIGDVIFEPWVATLKDAGVKFQTSTFVTGLAVNHVTKQIEQVRCKLTNGKEKIFPVDDVVLAVGAKALNSIVRNNADLARYPEFRRFANLRGTSVLATRILLDQNITIPYSANACWGFDDGVGMTVFDIKELHGYESKSVVDAPGSVLEVDYYHSSKLLAMSDDEIVSKVKHDLDTIFGGKCQSSNVVDAAVVRLPDAVNWYFPGSYKDMPDVQSKSLCNLYFCGDIVRTRHGSWSQEKAFVTGVEACNAMLRQDAKTNIIPMSPDEAHVALGKSIAAIARDMLRLPSLVDFIW